MHEKVRFDLNGVKKRFFSGGLRAPKTPVPVLNGLDLKIYEHRFNGLVGPSGSGKSTLTRILMGLSGFDGGDIIYKGDCFKQVPRQRLYRENAIMFQNPYLAVNPCFKVRRIIVEPLRIRKIKGAVIKSRLEEMVTALEIDEHLLQQYPHQLSGGELQRVVLARTLIGRPEFVFLDEPLSALDEFLADRFLEYFKLVFSRLGIGILYVSHRLDYVRRLTEYISILEDGEIGYHGTTEAWTARIPENVR